MINRFSLTICLSALVFSSPIFADIAVITHLNEGISGGSLQYRLSIKKFGDDEVCGPVVASGEFGAVNVHMDDIKIPSRHFTHSYCFQFAYHNAISSDWTKQIIIPDYEVNHCDLHVYVYHAHLKNLSQPILKISDANGCEFPDSWD